MTAEEIIRIYREFCAWQAVLYALGVSLAILDFQGFSFVERNLVEFLKTKVPNKFNEYF
ncbi:MAG: hypothetical protein AB1465_05715 [Patescibacteria group bacterium]